MGFSQQATWFDTLIKFLLLSIILLYYYMDEKGILSQHLFAQKVYRVKGQVFFSKKVRLLIIDIFKIEV